jgi:hypothetical protein
MDRTITSAERVALNPFAPPTALSVTLRVTIEPKSGALLIYTHAQQDPIRADGPQAEVTIPLDNKQPNHEIFVQRVAGAEHYQCECLGYEDDI